MERGHKPLDPDAFEFMANETRADTGYKTGAEFAKVFIPNSISIGLEGNFAQMVGRTGYRYQPGDIDRGWRRQGGRKASSTCLGWGMIMPLDICRAVLKPGKTRGKGKIWSTVSQRRHSKTQLRGGELLLVDVRKKANTIPNMWSGVNMPLHLLNSHLAELPRKTLVIHCAGGYRSIVAGFHFETKGLG